METALLPSARGAGAPGPAPATPFARAANTFDTQGLVTYRWDTDTSLDSNRNGFPDDDADVQVIGVSNQLAVTSFVPTRTGAFTARLASAG